MNKIVAILLVIGISFLLYSSYLILQRNSPIAKAITNNYVYVKNNYEPISIQIPDLNIDLPIMTVSIENNKWEDPKKNVGFWKDSALPGTIGNTVLYGHNWPNLLGNLTKIKKGENIFISMSDNTKIKFNVIDTFIITADQTHILNKTDDTRLTLYTCTGFLDSKRFVVIAIPEL